MPSWVPVTPAHGLACCNELMREQQPQQQTYNCNTTINNNRTTATTAAITTTTTATNTTTTNTYVLTVCFENLTVAAVCTSSHRSASVRSAACTSSGKCSARRANASSRSGDAHGGNPRGRPASDTPAAELSRPVNSSHSFCIQPGEDSTYQTDHRSLLRDLDLSRHIYSLSLIHI